VRYLDWIKASPPTPKERESLTPYPSPKERGVIRLEGAGGEHEYLKSTRRL